MARLIDSSLWVDFTRKKSPTKLKSLILPWIMDSSACICEPIAFEILRHASAQESKMIRSQFSTLPILSTPKNLWYEAAQLGKACKAKGINAGSMDLIIAALAIHHQAELITFDQDFLNIAKCSSLKVHLLEKV